MAKTSKSLIDLIEIAATRHGGASGRRLAELAQRAGHDISHATLNRLRQGTYATRPSDASIRAIAFLADVSENVAFAAADPRISSSTALRCRVVIRCASAGGARGGGRHRRGDRRVVRRGQRPGPSR
ncbi:hypothetical protein [Mycolicibacter icosiumassiliensis]|uniref:hypothetical protein n=1 Tax=Mycolicibacter icosiumassiliensis TaxID=1792835 RepID=UPI001F401631|nr:hypothetical protein [Mycolicibacter icosiumassiliensis]